MKQLMEALKGARHIEIWIAAAMLCVLLVLWIGDGTIRNEAASTAELRLERILSRIDGAGEVTVMLSLDEDIPIGCVAACPGAGDVRVQLELQRALQTLTGLALDKIEIVKSRAGR